MDATVTDLATGDTVVMPGTKEKIVVEVTSKSHPFYTGKQKLVDSENLVSRFEEKVKRADTSAIAKKKEKRMKRNQKTTNLRSGKRVTLKDMLQNAG